MQYLIVAFSLIALTAAIPTTLHNNTNDGGLVDLSNSTQGDDLNITDSNFDAGNQTIHDLLDEYKDLNFTSLADHPHTHLNVAGVTTGDNDHDDSDDDDSSDDESSIDDEHDSETEDSHDEDSSADDSTEEDSNEHSSDDESGEYSNENSEDVSDNRSGSSLNSEEKDVKRKEYLDQGIEEFDNDIKTFLKSVGQEELYNMLSSASSTSSLALSTLFAIAMLAMI